MGCNCGKSTAPPKKATFTGVPKPIPAGVTPPPPTPKT